MEKKYNTGKFTSFLKKNIYYLLMIVCILAIGTMITIAAINSAKNRDPNVIVNTPDPTDPQVTDPDPDPVVPIVFELPVKGAEIGDDYSMEALLYNSTLKQWQVHRGIDFVVAEGTDVVAAYDGIIKSIDNNKLYGTVVTIEHKDGLATLYSSFVLNDDVVLNQIVKKGDVIGKVANTNLTELKVGPHLHFEVKVNNEYKDPNVYLPIEEK